MGDYGGAESLFRKALTLLESSLGVDHLDTIACVSSLANLVEARGDNSGAEPLHRRVMLARERILGAEHPL